MPNFRDRQTYFAATGVSIDPARSEFGPSVRGGGVKLGDVEEAYNPFHRQLATLGIVDLSATEAQGTSPASFAMCRRQGTLGDCIPAPCEDTDAQHGSSVLGMLLARDGDSGIRGIVPDAQAFFASRNLWSQDQVSGSEAIRRTIAKLGAGDVMLLEMQGPLAIDPQQGGPADITVEIDDLVRTATRKGIIVVMGAGNSGLDLDSLDELKSYRARPDNGAIIVGAAASDGSGQRTRTSNYGSPVDVYAWGDGIVTAGYSYDIERRKFRRIWPAPETEDFTPDRSCVDATGQAEILAEIGKRPRNYYTKFGGTSGASAMVAGLAVAISAFAKDQLGLALTSVEVRDLLKKTGKKPIANLGVLPDLRAALLGLMTVTVSSDSPYIMTQHRRIGAEEGWLIPRHGSTGTAEPSGPLLLAAEDSPSVATLYVGLSGPGPKSASEKLILTTVTRMRYPDGISLSADGRTWYPVTNGTEGFAGRCVTTYDLTAAISQILLSTFGVGNFSINPVANLRFRFQNQLNGTKPPPYDHIYDEILLEWGKMPAAGSPCPDKPF